jgi:hypothetical protein
MIKIRKDIVNSVLNNLSKVAKQHVRIGVPEAASSRNEASMTNASLAYIHENGSAAANIPARPFLIPGVQAALPAALSAMKPYVTEALTKPEALSKGLNAAGLVAQTAVKKRIVSGEGFAPLAPATLEARARSGAMGTKPLIRTGSLLNSIKYVVSSK